MRMAKRQRRCLGSTCKTASLPRQASVDSWVLVPVTPGHGLGTGTLLLTRTPSGGISNGCPIQHELEQHRRMALCLPLVHWRVVYRFNWAVHFCLRLETVQHL